MIEQAETSSRPEMSPAGNGLVQIAYLHKEHVSHSWVHSLIGLRDYDSARPIPQLAPKVLNIRCATGRLVPSRNFGTKLFLDKTPHEWLLWVDTDMGFHADAVERLMEVADPEAKPVVGALCFAPMIVAYDGMGGYHTQYQPTMYLLGHQIDTGRATFATVPDYPQDTMVQVAGTGAAFLLMHRGILERIREKWGDCWWDQIVADDGDLVGEDLSFCARVNDVGGSIWVHTAVKTSHHKEIWISERDYQLTTEPEPTPEVPPDLPVYVHVPASLASLVADEHVRPDGMLKLPEDLARYRQIIEATKPEVIVETGTRTGASARWFAERGCDVITVDVATDEDLWRSLCEDGIVALVGDSATPEIAARVGRIVGDRRCMVVLDSDHSAQHVATEIALYGDLVTPGCYLVVEDTIFGLATQAMRAQHGLADMVGSPMDAVRKLLVGNPAWMRDIAIEREHPKSHHPGGWWIRTSVAEETQ